MAGGSWSPASLSHSHALGSGAQLDLGEAARRDLQDLLTSDPHDPLAVLVVHTDLGQQLHRGGEHEVSGLIIGDHAVGIGRPPRTSRVRVELTEPLGESQVEIALLHHRAGERSLKYVPDPDHLSSPDLQRSSTSSTAAWASAAQPSAPIESAQACDVGAPPMMTRNSPLFPVSFR